MSELSFITFPTDSNSLEMANSTDGSIDVLQLSSILFQCFALIILGYVSGRFSIISEVQSRGLTNFVSYFALPSLIFLSLAQSDLSMIDWYFVASVCIAKVSVFILVLVITLLTTRPYNLGKAGLYGIFCTQSNDFAFGYPIFSSLYSKSHPSFPDYLYVIAPLQLLLINPVGLFLLEMNKYNESIAGTDESVKTKPIVILGRVVKNTLTNPIILMTLGGLIWNVTIGHTVPLMILGLLKSLGDAFSPTALFLLGLNIVQETGFIKNSAKVVVPSTLIGVKLFILPVILRLVARNLVQGDSEYVSSMANFGFLYGTIPCAPTALIFSLTYNVACWVISYGLIIATIISAPLMFVSANMIRYSSYSFIQVEQDLSQTISIISLIAIPCAVWTIFIFLIGFRWTSITHRVTFILLFCQLTVAIGGYISPSEAKDFGFRYFLPLFGIFASRIWTAVLALTLVLLQKRSLCYALRLQNLLSVIAIAICILFSGCLYLIAPYSPDCSKDPYFKFGIYQGVPMIMILLMSITITGVAIILQERNRASVRFYEQLDNDALRSSSPEASSSSLISSSHPESRQESTIFESHPDPETVSIEDLISDSVPSQVCQNGNCQSGNRQKSCMKNLQRYWSNTTQTGDQCPTEANWTSLSFQRHIQSVSHLALLLILVLSMIIDLTVCISKFFSEKLTGIAVEMTSLAIFLVYGQAITTFVLFGLDLTPLIDFWRCLLTHTIYRHRQPQNSETDENLSDESRHVCHQFANYHREKCAKDICFHITKGGFKLHVFKGRDLVNWLVESGLAANRKAGLIYASHLFKGRLIGSLTQSPFFLDTSCFYQFINHRLTTKVNENSTDD